MKLRQETGAGMMECKKFLLETVSDSHPEGDIEAAIIAMRKAARVKAENKASRIAAEGVVLIYRSADSRSAVIIEINSETDFVARDQEFMGFAEKVGMTLLNNKQIKELSELTNTPIEGTDHTVESARQALIAKIGENIQIRRFERLNSESIVGTYLHGSRIGVIVSLKNGDEELAKDLAMHIAASRPLVVSREQVSQEAIENERDIFTAQARESGKPQEIIDKMIEGRINKFIDEISLLGQPFVKDPNVKINQILQQKNAEVLSFIRYEVGEGIQKKIDNFVEEVMAQAQAQDRN